MGPNLQQNRIFKNNRISWFSERIVARSLKKERNNRNKERKKNKNHNNNNNNNKKKEQPNKQTKKQTNKQQQQQQHYPKENMLGRRFHYVDKNQPNLFVENKDDIHID